MESRMLKLTDQPSKLGISKKIRIIAVSIIKNELDIIEPFLRHNHFFFDAMLVIDNCSSDGTRDILHSCAKELENVVFCDFPEFAYDQSQYTTLVTRFIQSTYRSDFIVFLDADEFISAKDRAIFENSIAMIPPRGTGMMPRKTYLPDPQHLEHSAQDPMQSIRRRRLAELPQFFKPILRLDGEMLAMTVEPHAHNINDMKTQVPLQSVILDDLSLIHIPVRSPEQLISKSLIGWVANVARDPKTFASSNGFHCRDIFEKVVHQQMHLFNLDACLETLRYAQDDRDFSIAADTKAVEPPVSTVRKFSDGAFGSVLANVAAAFLSNLLQDTNVADAKIDKALTPQVGKKEPRVPGVFDDSWHHDMIFVDRPPFEYLARKYSPNSVLDVGCGAGWYLKLLAELGANDIQGVDGISSEAVMIDVGRYKKVDLHEPFEFGKKFDLVMCIEVLEHLNPKATQILFDGLAKHAGKTILFSVAEPDQPGVDHINCIPMSQVLKEWKSRGWAPDLFETYAVRGLSTLSWLRRNLLVLKPIAQIYNASESIAEFARIGAEKFDWYHQDPGVRKYAFHEAFPEITSVVNVNLAKPMPINQSSEGTNSKQKPEVGFSDERLHLEKLVNEVAYLRASLQHIRRYPWKYLISALREWKK